jgi:hypothetical protein
LAFLAFCVEKPPRIVQRKDDAKAPISASLQEINNMTHIWYEVFPVTLVDTRPMLLQDPAHLNLSPWMLPHRPNIHPNTVVIEYLNTILGQPVCNEKTIVHSTSWRYDTGHDWMLLTYLAILPQSGWQTRLQPDRQIMLAPIGEIAARFGDQLFPPEQIERQHVLAHALDHLASLNTYDPSIQTTLETDWQAILRSRQPKPAGCLQRSLAFPAQSVPHAGMGSLHAERAQASALALRT